MTTRGAKLITRYGTSPDCGTLDESTQPRFDGTSSSVVPSDFPLGPGCVDNSVGTTRGGFSVVEQPWFKVWSKESLGSTDLNSLTDHEERVWWRLMMIGGVQSERWCIRLDLPVVARLCASTLPKTKAALARFTTLGMVTPLEDGGFFLTNAPKYQDTPEARRKRAERERQAEADKSRTSHGQVTGRVAPNVTVEERGKKKEVRSVSNETHSAAPAASPRAITPAYLEEIQSKHPAVDVREVYEDARNRKTWDGYKDKRRALIKYIGWAEEKAAQGGSRGNGYRQAVRNDDPLEWCPGRHIRWEDSGGICYQCRDPESGMGLQAPIILRASP